MAVELKAVAGLDGSQFEGEIGKLRGSLDNFGKNQLGGLKGLIAGAFSVGAIASFGRSLLQTAHDLKETAEASGVSMQSMVALNTAAKENGLQTEKLQMMMHKLSAEQGKVVDGNKEMLGALKALGISAEEFVGMDVDRVLERIAKGYADAGGAAEAYNAITELFGMRIGPAMFAMLDKINTEGLDKMKEAAEGAAQGMNGLAEAQENLQKAQAGIQQGAGWIAGKIMQAAEWYAVQEEKFRAKRAGYDPNAIGDLTDRTEEAARERKRKANLAALAERQAAELKAAQDKANKAWLDYYERQDAEIAKRESAEQAFIEKDADLRRKYQEKEADILSGKGIGAPEAIRGDRLQAIGGIVGGVSGAGGQAARIAERQEKIQAEHLKLQKDTIRELTELKNTAQRQLEALNAE